MPPRLQWCDGAPAAIPRVRVERFCARSKRRVWLLGEVRCQRTHHRKDENTVPCLAPAEPCPYCKEPLWKTRYEHFAAALLMDEEVQKWVPIVAVFTPGGRNQLDKYGGDFRGRVLEVFRRNQGNAQGGVLIVNQVARIEPLIPAFDIEPHLLRLWFPFAEEELPPVEIPPSVPYLPEAAPPRPSREPTTTPTPEERAIISAMFKQWRKRVGLDKDETPPAELDQVDATTAAVEQLDDRERLKLLQNPEAYGPLDHVAGPRPDDTPPPVKKLQTPTPDMSAAARRRAMQQQQQERTDAAKNGTDRLAEAAQGLDDVMAFIQPSTNGHAKEGGEQ